MELLKKTLKGINIDELLFDIPLLIITSYISFFLFNDNLLNTDIERDSYIVTAGAGILVFLLFINVGEILGRYKEANNFKRIRIVFVSFVLLSAVSLLFIVGNIIEEIDRRESDMLIIIIMACMIPGFLIGYYSKVKSFKKAMKVSGIITFTFLVIALCLFILSQINQNHLREVEIVFAAILFIVGIVFFLILPSKTASFITKRRKLKEFIIYTFIIISALTFSLWDFVINEEYIVEDLPGYFRKDEFYYLMYLPLIVYRFLLAAAPPKNKINVIIGIVVLLVIILL